MAGSRRSGRIWWMGGLVVVFALLAHDGLMGAVVHAAPDSPAVIDARHSPNYTLDAIEDPMDREPAPAHPRDCSTTGDAILAAGPELESAENLPTILATDLQISSLIETRHWVEPLWPPGDRRAWLQVYRM